MAAVRSAPEPDQDSEADWAEPHSLPEEQFESQAVAEPGSVTGSAEFAQAVADVLDSAEATAAFEQTEPERQEALLSLLPASIEWRLAAGRS